MEDKQLDKQQTVVYLIVLILSCNDWIIVKNELECTWKEPVVVFDPDV
jgi:hypothetical protein